MKIAGRRYFVEKPETKPEEKQFDLAVLKRAILVNLIMWVIIVLVASGMFRYGL